MRFDQMNIVKAPKDILAGPIADFQAFAGLNVTGVLDTDTITLMKTPRFNIKSDINRWENCKVWSSRYYWPWCKKPQKAVTYHRKKKMQCFFTIFS